jgi:hypothetical protein
MGVSGWGSRVSHPCRCYRNVRLRPAGRLARPARIVGDQRSQPRGHLLSSPWPRRPERLQTSSPQPRRIGDRCWCGTGVLRDPKRAVCMLAFSSANDGQIANYDSPDLRSCEVSQSRGNRSNEGEASGGFFLLLGFDEFFAPSMHCFLLSTNIRALFSANC